MANIRGLRSRIKGITSTQQITDTGNSPAPSHAAMIPAISATSPEIGVWVAWMMAGKVMTASVT